MLLFSLRPALGSLSLLGHHAMRWPCSTLLVVKNPEIISSERGNFSLHRDAATSIVRSSHHAPCMPTGDGFPKLDIGRSPDTFRDVSYADISVPYANRPPRRATPHRFVRRQLSRTQRKAQRRSRPAQVLAAIASSAKIDLYFTHRLGRIDWSYKAPRHPTIPQCRPHQVTLDSILARFLRHHTDRAYTGSDFHFSAWELRLLQSRGYSKTSVRAWASCILEPRSNVAVKLFEPGLETPPFFLLKLFLRRKHVRVLALNTILIHLGYQLRPDHMCWSSLKVLVVRLLRHAREVRPDSMPWIASFFIAQSARLHKFESASRRVLHKFRRDITSFCNTFLLLISLPGSIHPVLFARYQEKAQLQVLQYMASASPSIMVNRKGFRSITRTQLTHVKTDSERQWAELKSPSWPPWKANRTAMDEDKGYELGTSRASRVLHRMYEAGYSKRAWEDMAEVYAGWDVDFSPTIQTRTSLSRFSTQFEDVNLLRSLTWAGRIRATRTRREAWAGFLAYEAAKAPAHPEVYLAIFEKLCCAELRRTPASEASSGLHESLGSQKEKLLPGDMKEVLPDQESPMHYVYISEPIPTYKQMYRRMCLAIGQPTGRLLALIAETCPDFQMTWHTLALSKDGIGHLSAGQHHFDSQVRTMPGYLFAAFIRFLCRFGHFDRSMNETPTLMPPEEHILRRTSDRHYLLEYAHALLMHYRPHYPPAWNVYANKLVQHKGTRLGGDIPRYKALCNLYEVMEDVGIDINDESFRLFCTGTFYAVQAAMSNTASKEDTRFVMSTGWSRLRVLFETLVGADAEKKLAESVSEKDRMLFVHIPSPAELHAYVRALGILCDWEGLYSFSIWLTRYHAEVKARAETRHGGRKLLFVTLVGLRAAIEGRLVPGLHEALAGSEGVAELIKKQVEAANAWGFWPSRKHVDLYMKGQLKSEMSTADGR